jgi:hypothetical protein
MPQTADWVADLLDEIEKGFSEGIADVVKQAMALSSGPYSLGELAAMDHPYAKRHGVPLLPPEIINVQTGDFRRAWRGGMTLPFGDDLEGQITNDNWVSDYLTQPAGGHRSNMFQRPIDKEVEDDVPSMVENRVNQRVADFGKRTYRI